jgi:hypothetical protein
MNLTVVLSSCFTKTRDMVAEALSRVTGGLLTVSCADEKADAKIRGGKLSSSEFIPYPLRHPSADSERLSSRSVCAE